MNKKLIAINLLTKYRALKKSKMEISKNKIKEFDNNMMEIEQSHNSFLESLGLEHHEKGNYFERFKQDNNDKLNHLKLFYKNFKNFYLLFCFIIILFSSIPFGIIGIFNMQSLALISSLLLLPIISGALIYLTTYIKNYLRVLKIKFKIKKSGLNLEEINMLTNQFQQEKNHLSNKKVLEQVKMKNYSKEINEIDKLIDYITSILNEENKSNSLPLSNNHNNFKFISIDKILKFSK